MPRIYKRFHPKNSSYVRKTETEHGQEVVKPIEHKDFDEMVRLCLLHRDQCRRGSWSYYRWYRDYVILIVGVNTGCRITTICEQIPRDYAGGKVTITEHKTGKRMQYDISPTVHKVIQAYIDEFHIGQNEFMFRTNPGSKDSITRSGCWKFISRLVKEAGINYPVACHSLRKSYGRWMYDQTKDILLVSRLLMHDNPLETMRYICLEDAEVDRIRSQISNIPRYE